MVSHLQSLLFSFLFYLNSLKSIWNSMFKFHISKTVSYNKIMFIFIFLHFQICLSFRNISLSCNFMVPCFDQYIYKTSVDRCSRFSNILFPPLCFEGKSVLVVTTVSLLNFCKFFFKLFFFFTSVILEQRKKSFLLSLV